MRPADLLATAAVLDALLQVTPLAAQARGVASAGRAQSEPGCRHQVLSQRPGWTASGAWEGGNLLLVDTLAATGKLLRYSVSGNALAGALPLGIPKTLGRAASSRIATQGDKLVVQVGASRFVNLGPGRSFSSATDASWYNLPADGSTIDKVLTWAPAGNDIIGFAEVKSPGERWSSGVVRFPQQDSQTFRYLKNLSTLSASRKFHRLGYQYTAAIGSTGYVLLMEEGGFRLYRSAPPSDDLKEMKALGRWSVPELPNFTQPEDYAAVMGVVEESAMPVGLYAWGKDLYLLSRQPAGSSTEWRLSRIDVERDRIVETTVIPSRAHHLFAVPGPDQWAFVEKGAARGLRQQVVETGLLVPSTRIQHPNAILCQ